MPRLHCEHEAFERIYRDYGRDVHGLCRRLCGNRAEAEDLAQDAMFTALKSFGSLRDPERVKSWLLGIVVMRWRTRRRWRLRRPEAQWEADVPGPDPTEAHSARLALATAIAHLPEKERVAFLLVKVEGLTCVEASAVLRIPVGTLKFQIHSAIKKLRNLIDSERDIPVEKEPAHAV